MAKELDSKLMNLEDAFDDVLQAMVGLPSHVKCEVIFSHIHAAMGVIQDWRCDLNNKSESEDVSDET